MKLTSLLPLVGKFEQDGKIDDPALLGKAFACLIKRTRSRGQSVINKELNRHVGSQRLKLRS